MTLPSQTVLTVPGNPNYTLRTRFDGRDFNLKFLWNEREERWYLDIRTDSDLPIVMGIKLITNRPLLRFYKFDARLPPGELYAWSLTTDESPPGLFELGSGKRVELSYHPVGF
jgi:hypothetical protein